MKTLCYYLTGDYEETLYQLELAIPCFVWHEKDGSTTIMCREADAALVEQKLANFV